MPSRKHVIKTYLSGPIGDVSAGEAKTWRVFITKKLAELGIKTLNPLEKKKVTFQQSRAKLANWRKHGNIDAIRQFAAKRIIPPDLQMVKESDFVTFWLPVEEKEVCGCVDETTEIFTLKGFKKYDELEMGDEIISYNLEKKKLEVDRVYAVFKYNYKGKILSLENKDISMRVTPNHRCVIRSFKDHKIKVKKAEKLLERDEILQKAEFNNPFSSGLSRKEGRIVGIILSDGQIQQCGITILQEVGEKQEIVEKWLKDYNIKYSTRIRKVKRMEAHSDKKVVEYFIPSSFTQELKKMLPSKEDNLFHLLKNPQDFLEGVFEGLTLSDGYKKRDDVEFTWKKEDISDFIQALSILLNKQYKGSLNKTLGNTQRLSVSSHEAIRVGRKRLISYKGIVWCPRTGNGTWIARRRGTIFITGNSYGEITLAFELGIPVYIVTKRRLKPVNIPEWAIGCSTKIFSNWDDFLKYIKENWVE